MHSKITLKPTVKIPLVKTPLYLAVSAGLTRMQLRRLDSTPSSVNMPTVAHVMTEDFIRAGFGDSDCERIAEAIEDAGVKTDRFPTFYNIRGHVKTLRRIEENHRKLKALPETKDQVRQKRLIYNKHIKAVLAVLTPSAPVAEKTKVKEKHTPANLERRERIKRDLKNASVHTEYMPIKTPEEIETEENRNEYG